MTNSPYSTYYNYSAGTGWASAQPTINWGSVIKGVVDGAIGHALAIGSGNAESINFTMSVMKSGSTVTNTVTLQLYDDGSGNAIVKNWGDILTNANVTSSVDALITLLPGTGIGKMILGGVVGGVMAYVKQTNDFVNSTTYTQLVNQYATSNAVDMQFTDSNGTPHGGIFYFDGILKSDGVTAGDQHNALGDLMNSTSNLLGGTVKFADTSGNYITSGNLAGTFTIYDGTGYDLLGSNFQNGSREGTTDLTGLGNNSKMIAEGTPSYLIARSTDNIQVNAAGLTIHPSDIYVNHSVNSDDHNKAIIGTSSSDSLISAGTSNDVLLGLGGNDTLNGGNGNDILVGDDKYGITSGNDYIYGGAGNDTIFGSLGNDTINGGADSNTLDYTVLYKSINASYPSGYSGLSFVANDTANPNYATNNTVGSVYFVGTSAPLLKDTVSNIQHFFGTNGADNADLSPLPDGTTPADAVSSVDTGAGNDTVIGGGSTDATITLGTGADKYYAQYASANTDTLTDFSYSNGDKIDLSKMGETLAQAQADATQVSGNTILNWLGHALVTIIGVLKADLFDPLNAAFQNAIGGTSGNALVGNSSANTIDTTHLDNSSPTPHYATANNDTLTGNAGNDTLNGGAGSDTYIFNKGDGNDDINEGQSTTDRNILQLAGISHTQVFLNTVSTWHLKFTVNDGAAQGSVINNYAWYNLPATNGYRLSFLQLSDQTLDLTGALTYSTANTAGEAVIARQDGTQADTVLVAANDNNYCIKKVLTSVAA